MRIETSLRLPSDSYFAEQPKKDLIVLHHTVGGSAKSTLDYWRTDAQHIGTAYIVERDGSIFEVFPPECWAFHLGLKIGPIGVVDKRSIGIEIASEGPLINRGGKFYTFGRVTEQTLFTGQVFDVESELNSNPSAPLTPSEVRGVGGMSTDFRGYRYFAAYTPQAIGSVCELVNELCTRFNIPRQTPGAHTDFDLNGLRNYAGVLTHSQLRADKSDCHPGFDWKKLIMDCRLQSIGQFDIKAMAAENISQELMTADLHYNS